MSLRTVRRSAGLAIAAALVIGGLALADTVAGDADTVSGGTQASRSLGPVFVSSTTTLDVGFELRCKGLQHVDAGQSVTLHLDSATVPVGGVASATDGVIGPVPAGWTSDGQGCNSNLPVAASTLSTVSLTAPPVAGTYTYTLAYSRSLSPAGTNDALATSGFTAVDLIVTVIPNTPPILVLPGDITVEGDTSGGAIAAYAVSATDAEDDPDPTPTCSPALGTLLPLGATTVGCTVTDLGGLSDSDAFTITVVDTTAPTLSAVPSGLAVDTADAGGAVVSWPHPSATDVVDESPIAGCSPASGSTFPVGTTQVLCTATDASGNSSSAGFDVVVSYTPPPPPAGDPPPPPPGDPPPPSPSTVDLHFEAPVSGRGSVIIGRDGWPGRVLPVHLELWSNGSEIRSGSVTLVLGDLDQCGPGGSLTSALVPAGTFTWAAGPDRWALRLRVGGLAAGCHQAVVLYDGESVGTFDIRVLR